MSFSGNAVADFDTPDFAADIDDLADEFMSDGHRNPNRLPGPVVPIENMNIRAADSGLANAYEYIVVPDFRLRYIVHPDAFRRVLFYQCSHCRILDLANDAKFLADFSKCRNGPINVLTAVSRRHLRADSRLAFRYHRKGKAYDVNSFLEQSVGHLCRQFGITQHDRNNWVLARQEVKSERRHLRPEILRIGLQPVT